MWCKSNGFKESVWIAERGWFISDKMIKEMNLW